MKKKDNEKVIQESMLKLASTIYVNEEGEKLLQEAKELNKSEEDSLTEEEKADFEKFCKKELKQNPWRFTRFAKTATVAALLGIVVSTCVHFDPSWFKKSGPDSQATTEYQGVVYDGIGNHKKKYELKYLPKGFKESELSNSDVDGVVLYTDKKEKTLTFVYKKANKEMKKNFKNIQEIKEMLVNGNKAKLQIEEQYILTWIADGYYFTIEASGISEEELIKIAESIKEK